MNNRLAQHMMEIATDGTNICESVCQLVSEDGKVYVVEPRRFLITNETVVGLDMNSHRESTIRTLDRLVDTVFDEKADYTLHYLPTAEDIRLGIKAIAGRKYGTKVIWSDGIITINARLLLKAMSALNARVCYVGKNNTKMPIAFFKDDDVQSETIELIMPVINYGNKIGFWEV